MENYSNYYDDWNLDYSSESDPESSENPAIDSVMNVVELIIICTGIPLTLLAIVTECFLAKQRIDASIYVANLLISDLLQLCCLAVWNAGYINDITDHIHTFALMVSIGFMVCISVERYLAIAAPLWFRFKRTLRTSLVVCVVVWPLPLVLVISKHFSVHVQFVETGFFLLPLPLFLFCLVGTFKILSGANSVPADEKRRIVTILVLVLLIYTLLFLPYIICSVVEIVKDNRVFLSIAFVLLYLSPFADLTLYFFIRKSVTDTLLESLCCCEMFKNQETSSKCNENMSAPSTEAV